MARKLEILVETVAKTVHEVNRGYCAALGDDSQVPWKDAPEWQKRSAIAGVMAILTGEVTTPEDLHVGWFEQKSREGWRYGPIKSPERKEHPCMVPYNDLPVTQRAKDHIFFTLVRSMMEEFEIVLESDADPSHP